VLKGDPERRGRRLEGTRKNELDPKQNLADNSVTLLEKIWTGKKGKELEGLDRETEDSCSYGGNRMEICCTRTKGRTEWREGFRGAKQQRKLHFRVTIKRAKSREKDCFREGTFPVKGRQSGKSGEKTWKVLLSRTRDGNQSIRCAGLKDGDRIVLLARTREGWL